MSGSDEITVSIDNGANIHSKRDHKISLDILGFDSRQEWDDATEDEKMEAVIEYWNMMGALEYSWED